MDEFVGHTAGLLAFNGSTSSGLGRLLGAGQLPAATHLLERLQKLFDGRLYIELQRHGEDGERRIEAPLLELAYARGLPLLGTNEPVPALGPFSARGFRHMLVCTSEVAGGRY